jgi:hypothetical protein
MSPEQQGSPEPDGFMSFADVLNERLADALTGLHPEQEETGDGGEQQEHLIPPLLKHEIMVQVSDGLLMDCGAIPDTRERKPIARRTLLRWWLSGRRERAAELAYRVIAGHDVPGREW